MRVRGLLVALMSLAVWTLVPGVLAASADSCPNAVLRTGPSASLPDCRAYEMVSPPFKSGGAPFTGEGVTGVLDGSHIVLDSIGAWGEALDNGGAGGAFYSTTRGASGWSSTPISPPLSQFLLNGNGVTDVSRDFSKELFLRKPRSSKPLDSRFYIREPDGSLVEVGPVVPPAAVAAWTPADRPPSLGFYWGASPDLSHVLFTSQEEGVEGGGIHYLWPGDGTVVGGESLYEYVGTGNSAPRLVGVDDEGRQISQCGTELGALNAAARFNAVSTSGNTVFFSVAHGGCQSEGVTGSGPLVDEVYARVDGSATVSISEPSVGDCAACDTTLVDRAPGIFQGASQDGSKAFFLSSQPLLDGDSTQNLYSYDFGAPAGEKVVRVSAGDPAGANVQGVVDISADGSRVYFVAQGVLTNVPNGMGHSAVEGEENLYLYQPDPAHPGQSETVFVTALSGSDEGDWGLNDSRPVEVTSDGRFLLFRSRAGLTVDCAACTGPQLYRYDANTGALVRVSIGENGFNQNGTTLTSVVITVPRHALSFAGPQRVSISDDGAYVFFASPTALTAQALNSFCLQEEGGECIEYEENIYEYREGHVYLISDGRDRNAVLDSATTRLFGASPSGADVFFASADPLVAQDTDTQMDVYDARIDGGFPAPAAPVSCQGEECQGGLSPSAPGQVPGSATFSGPGNPVPPRVAVKKKVVKKPVKHVSKKARKHRKKRRAGSPHAAGKGR